MGYWDQEWGGSGKSGQIWTWAVVGSLLAHGLLVAGILLILTEKTASRRVVVPVEAIALVPRTRVPRGVVVANPPPRPNLSLPPRNRQPPGPDPGSNLNRLPR